VRLLIATDGKNPMGVQAVWTLLDKLKPTFLIVRNQPGVDMLAYNWAKKHNVPNVRAPLSALPKNLMDQKPDAVLNFGWGRDKVLKEFIPMAKRAQVAVIPVAY
jgi:hypothetical protein